MMNLKLIKLAVLIGACVVASVAQAQPLHHPETVRALVGRSAEMLQRIGPPRERASIDTRYGSVEVLRYVTWDGYRHRIAVVVVVNGVVDEVSLMDEVRNN